MTVKQLKNILIELYFENEYTEALLRLVYQYNKNPIMKDIIEKLDTSVFLKTEEFKNLLSDIINNEDYYITYIDIYLIAYKYKLPIILICNTIINMSITENPFIILNKNTDKNTNYYLIKIPSQYYRPQIHKAVKNYKLLYFDNPGTIDIATEVKDIEKINLKSNILYELDNFKDLMLNAVIEYDNKLMLRKKKIIKKNKKSMN